MQKTISQIGQAGDIAQWPTAVRLQPMYLVSLNGKLYGMIGDGGSGTAKVTFKNRAYWNNFSFSSTLQSTMQDTADADLISALGLDSNGSCNFDSTIFPAAANLGTTGTAYLPNFSTTSGWASGFPVVPSTYALTTGSNTSTSGQVVVYTGTGTATVNPNGTVTAGGATDTAVLQTPTLTSAITDWLKQYWWVLVLIALIILGAYLFMGKSKPKARRRNYRRAMFSIAYFLAGIGATFASII